MHLIIFSAVGIVSVLGLVVNYRYRFLMVDPGNRASAVFGALLLLYIPSVTLSVTYPDPWSLNEWVLNVLPLAICASYLFGFLRWRRLKARWKHSSFVKIAGIAPILGPIFLALISLREAEQA
jgi:hypothetical protein